MSNAILNLQSALGRGTELRPKVAGFPVLAEALRQAGVTRNTWSLPSCQSVFVTTLGNVVVPGFSLVSGMTQVPTFDEVALITALRADQSGHSTFPEFLAASWEAGVICYDVDLLARKVSYFGATGDVYVEEYPAVELPESESPESSD
ncbi:MAG TPA: DUF1398 family protein [Fimbriimonas sp.]|nr:DUF1398 family protein [Fimbriimonas sp.]